jgi:hypothetical protein
MKTTLQLFDATFRMLTSIHAAHDAVCQQCECATDVPQLCAVGQALESVVVTFLDQNSDLAEMMRESAGWG